MKAFWNKMPGGVKVAAIFLVFVWAGWMLFFAATAQTAILLGWLTGLTVVAGIAVGLYLFISFIEWMFD